MVYHPSYDETQWRELQDKACPMRGVIKWSKMLGLTLNPSPRDASQEAYPSYHIKGL